MEVSTVVFARGGSKGLPGKNVKKFGGLPLIAHTIRFARLVPGIGSIYCSTDSPEIAEIALREGAEVPFLRPSSLATDTSPELGAWKHFAHFLLGEGRTPDHGILSLPATAPLRAVADVVSVLAQLATREADLVVTYSESPLNPWFNLAQIAEDGSLTVGVAPPTRNIQRRQDAPRVFALSPVAYGTTIGYVTQTQGIFTGKVRGVEVPRERSIDIDSQLDFQIAEYLYTLNMPNELGDRE